MVLCSREEDLNLWGSKNYAAQLDGLVRLMVLVDHPRIHPNSRLLVSAWDGLSLGLWWVVHYLSDKIGRRRSLSPHWKSLPIILKPSQYYSRT